MNGSPGLDAQPHVEVVLTLETEFAIILHLLMGALTALVMIRKLKIATRISLVQVHCKFTFYNHDKFQMQFNSQ